MLAAEREIASKRPEKLVLRVDRTDPSKNIVRGFRAFELYLDGPPRDARAGRHAGAARPVPPGHPRVRRVPGRDPARRAEPSTTASSATGWTPIDLQIADNFTQAVAAYKQFDVLLVNAIFDGLNLVAKEAPLVNDRDGVLILSENAGSHEELGEWALSINPFDMAGQAEAIHARAAAAARRAAARLEGIRAHVAEHDLAAWIEAQLADFDRGGLGRRQRAATATRSRRG